ncbi:hypothetical protein FPSE5266_20428 [Fusarium pseudograminearum]|nr:hypothetical protein FPSE5266_20428 [Fusarium pseudograminearum]
MTVDADGYNSSDEEFEEAPNPYANAGKASIEAIIAKATEDRKSSKKFLKQLRPTSQAPKSTYDVNLWGNRLETFMSSSLNLPPKTAPTADHLVRFFQSIPATLPGRSKDGKVSLSTMRNGLKWSIWWCRFYYKDWELSRSETVKLKSAFAELLNSELITSEPAEEGRAEKKWIGSDITRQVVANYLEDAITHGCSHWDKVIRDAMTFVLLSATGARAGDIAVAQGYDATYCLR